jgi:inosine-uridine nucleoside N-ribohydrolase
LVQKLIIDADPGIGDAVAIAVALHDPNLDVLAVTATAGRVSGEQATHNIQGIMYALDPPKQPRVGTSSGPRCAPEVEFEASVVSTDDLQGPGGLGECDFRAAELHRSHESAKLMIELVRTYPSEITLLTLGPLTNVEIAAERAPDFLSGLNGLVCLGGAVGVGGDVTPAAEFNIYADPEAARLVLCSAATKTLIPLDASAQVTLTFENYTRLQERNDTPLTRLMDEMLPFAFRAQHEFLGREGVQLDELVALAAVSRPRLCETRSLSVDVETRGELTRGMTVFDRRGIPRWQANIDAALDVDAQGVLDYLSSIVAGS